MQLVNKTTINKPLRKVWEVLADDFSAADKWMSTVPKSYTLEEGQKADGSDIVGRVCELSDKGDQGVVAHETITFRDNPNHNFKVEIVPKNGGILPVIKNNLDIKAKSLSEDKTEVIWTSDVELKPLGKILSPILKLGLNKGFDNILEELKYYLEKGIPHPRKVAKMKDS